MIIITNEYGQRVLIPNDLDTEWLLPVDELGLPEEERSYSKEIYIANILSFEDCKKMYVDVLREGSADDWKEINEPKEEENA